MSITKNIARVAEIQELTKNHLIGGKLEESDHDFIFYYHTPHFNCAGLKVFKHKFGSKALALKNLVARLDEIYNKEFGHSSSFKPLKTI